MNLTKEIVSIYSKPHDKLPSLKNHLSYPKTNPISWPTSSSSGLPIMKLNLPSSTSLNQYIKGHLTI